MSEKKQDPRVGRTRKALQDALLRLLKTKSFEKIKIKEIAIEAGLSRHAFYTHFDSKETLLFSRFDEVFDEVNGAILREEDSLAQTDMVSLFTKSLGEWKRHEEMVSYIMQVKNKDLVLERLRIQTKTVFETYLKSKNIYKQTHPMYGFILDYATGGGYMILQHWMNEKMKTDPKQLAQLVYKLSPLDLLIEHVDTN